MSREAERRAWTNFVESSQDAPSIPRKVSQIDFVVDYKAAPQGSMSGIAITRPDGTPATILKADNPRTHSYRRVVAQYALEARSRAGIHEVFAPAEVSVRVCITFVLARPKSAPKARTRPCVKPDLDKLTRSTMDALKGIMYADDGQVVDDEHHKIYGTPERVHISVQLVEE